MAVIDAQVHLYRKGTPIPPHQTQPFLVDDALRAMDEAGVDGAILHPPVSWDPDSNEQAVEAAQAWPERFAILGYPPLDLPDSAERVARIREQPGMLGLRLYFTEARKQSWPVDGTLDWLWPVAEDGRIAERHPDLKLAVDHMGTLRGARGRAAFPNMDQLVGLARYPNVAVKLTGGPFYADDEYPYLSLHEHYRVMYDAFGPQRLFWGTDITKMPCSWRDCVGHFQAIDWIPEADKRLIMGDAICAWLGWQRRS